MKIVLTQDELQAIVTEALANQGIDTSNATFEFDNGAEIELNATSKPTKQKRTRKAKQEVEQAETSDDDIPFNEESEEETNDFEDEPEEELTEETDSGDDSDSLFD